MIVCLKKFIGKQGYKDKVRFYALLKYAKAHEWKVDLFDNNYKHYRRITRNLLENTTVSNDNFTEVLQSVRVLAENCRQKSNEASKTTLPYFSTLDFKSFSFDQKQMKEEVIKAKLIASENKGWEEAIVATENHAFFKGQINFLLKKLNNSELVDISTSKEDLEEFRKYKTFAFEWWNENGANEEKGSFLLIRSILAKCDYIKTGWQWKLNLSNSSVNWKLLLKRGDINLGLIRLLKKGFDLEKVVQCDSEYNFINNAPLKTENWMFHIVKKGDELLKLSDSKKVQQYYDIGIFLFEKNNFSEGNILLSGAVAKRNEFIASQVKSGLFKLDANWRDTKISMPDSNCRYIKGGNLRLKHGNDKSWSLFLYTDKFVIDELKDEKWRCMQDNEKDIHFCYENLEAFSAKLTELGLTEKHKDDVRV